MPINFIFMAWFPPYRRESPGLDWSGYLKKAGFSSSLWFLQYQLLISTANNREA